jgi:hypothetical protein
LRAAAAGAQAHEAAFGAAATLGYWNGRRWSVVTLPAAAARTRYQVTRLAADGAGGIWAIGQCVNCQRTPSRLWHERGGRWSGPFVPRLARHRWMLFGLAAAGHSIWADGAVDGQRISGLIALRAPARSSSHRQLPGQSTALLARARQISCRAGDQRKRFRGSGL